ncbi:MAG TPA: Hpt domain-containing protein [Caulobacteraceae bacterium]|nr:Hpt domain-containing protein [Caulobacteraceae bacterium]
MSDPRAEKTVDFAVLEAYAMSDTTLVREVLTVFCAEAMEWSHRLDGDGWLEVVHTMKGTSRTIGAKRLGDLCEEAETDPARLPEVRAELGAVLEAVNDYLGRR